jgi:hypothetical protein
MTEEGEEGSRKSSGEVEAGERKENREVRGTREGTAMCEKEGMRGAGGMREARDKLGERGRRGRTGGTRASRENRGPSREAREDLWVGAGRVARGRGIEGGLGWESDMIGAGGRGDDEGTKRGLSAER